MCFAAGSHSSPFSDLIIDHCCVYMWYHRVLVYSVVAEDSRLLSYQVIDDVCNKDLIDLYSCFMRVIVVSDC